MALAETVVKFPIKTKLVCSSCGAPGEGSCRCGAGYVPWKEKAAADAIKADPDKSDYQIADAVGASRSTVKKVRNQLGTSAQSEKRTGKDGRQRKLPKPRGGGKIAEKYQQTRAAVRDSISAGQVLQTKKVAEQQGVSVDTVERAALAEQARIDVLDELGVDPKTLSMSAQAKVEIATRTMERKLNATHAARMREVDEEVRLRVIAENKDYLAMVTEIEAKARSEEKLWREIIDKHKPPFTVDQFKTILMCLHPDGHRTADKLAEAFRLFNDKKLQLTGKRN